MLELNIRFGDYQANILCKKAGNLARDFLPYINDTRSKIAVVRYERLRKNGQKQNKLHVFRVIKREASNKFPDGIFCIEPVYPTTRQFLAARSIQKFMKNCTR